MTVVFSVLHLSCATFVYLQNNIQWSWYGNKLKCNNDLFLSSTQGKEVNAFTQPPALVKAVPVSSLCRYWKYRQVVMCCSVWLIKPCELLFIIVCLCFSVMKAGPVVQGEESSLLLSPSVFQHSVIKATEAGKSSASPTSPTDPPTALYSRTQLQDTLIHLIKVPMVDPLMTVYIISAI